jgi:hypothetical protein
MMLTIPIKPFHDFQGPVHMNYSTDVFRILNNLNLLLQGQNTLIFNAQNKKADFSKSPNTVQMAPLALCECISFLTAIFPHYTVGLINYCGHTKIHPMLQQA